MMAMLMLVMLVMLVMLMMLTDDAEDVGRKIVITLVNIKSVRSLLLSAVFLSTSTHAAAGTRPGKCDSHQL